MEQLEPIKLLGQGAFGKVYLMRHKVARELVCVKVIQVKNIPKKEREACRLEVSLLKRLNHPNIVGYKESFLTKNRESLCIVMQYADGGDLAALIKEGARQGTLFSEAKILHWFVQMALGLHYMHSNRVLHRDLKTQNIFLLGNGRLVLGDLGISKVLDGTLDFAQTCIGTPYYMSPEIFKNKPYNHKSDIWALGCVLYEMTTLNHAFDANSLNGLACKIISGKYPPIASRYSTSLRELISQMLSTAPSSRPHLEVMLKRPFVKRHIRHLFNDFMSRPQTPGAVGSMARPDGLGVHHLSPTAPVSPEVAALKEQLESLQLNDILLAAQKDVQSPALTNTPSQDPVRTTSVQAQRAAREQASALRREEERKRSVEAALEKLKRERQQRLQNHERLKADARRRAAVRIQRPPTAAGSNQTNNSKRSISRRPVASAPEQPKEEKLREKSPVPRRSNGQRAQQSAAANRPSTGAAENAEARAVAELDKWAERLPARRATPPPNVRAATPKQDIQPGRPEKISAKAAHDLARAEALRKARRDIERERRGEIFEKLRQDKLALDQQLAKLRHLREHQPRRPPTANKQQAGGFIVFGDKPPPPPNDSESAIRPIENKEVEPPAPPAPPQDKNALPQKHEPEPCRPPLPPESQEPTTARDRVLKQRAQAQAEQEVERLRQLSFARHEASQQRQRARVQADSQYRSSMEGSPMANAHRVIPTQPPDSLQDNSDPGTPEKKVDTHKQDDEEEEEVPTRKQEDYSSHEDETFESHSEDEFDCLGCAVPEPDAVDQADEDLHHREEELQVELEYTKTRCEELRKSLEQTKSCIPEADKLPRRKQWETPADTPADNFCLYEEEYEEDSDFETTGASEESPLPPPEELPPEVPEDSSISEKKPVISCIEEEPDQAEPELPETPPPKLSMEKSPAVKKESSDNIPTAVNRIADRVQILRRRCIKTLGQEPFQAAYHHLKFVHDADDINADNVLELTGNGCEGEQDKETQAQAKLLKILGTNVRFAALIDQLIFMEDHML